MVDKIRHSIIFLPVISFLGIITSYEDFRFSKIRNKWILMGLLYSFTIYLLVWILYGLAKGKIISCTIGRETSYLIWNFDKWCINLLISTVMAYLLWHFKMWAAGDAKLFICYSSLIPIGQYSKVYFNYYFASFLLLLAIFIPATGLLFLRSIVYFIKGFNFKKTKERLPGLIKEKWAKLNKIETGKVFLGFFVFSLFFRLLRQEFSNLIAKILPNQNIVIFICLLGFNQLSKFFKKNIKFMVIVFVILIAYSGFRTEYPWQRFILEMSDMSRRTVLIMILFPIFKKTTDLYSERTQKTMPFAIWMFLGALITWFL